MTPEQIKAAREELGLNKAQFSEMLRLGKWGRKTVSRWESGEIGASKTTALAIELFLEKKRNATLTKG